MVIYALITGNTKGVARETLRPVYHCDRKRVIWGIHAGKIGNADTLLGYKKLLPLKLRA
ncbi:hypothetical protein [Trichocoleus sp. FACHB-40]|uniref:hypothetical protein n=2 Tax=Cyanophyceae TaxID=3028117 RepID=UPI001686DA09|nr:hypothetical protein [Trichocoleus sp. FACHB-40]MBD2005100.1 hypothetical protein [Trichocoleus sp. FACHB-40]